jgi:hypothetical protein
MGVNNFKQIRELLNFRSKDDFYFLQILQRKKDFKDTQKISGTNNNSRLVKAYYIKSLDHFDFLEDEIIKLCELFNARAGINLNRRSFKKTSLQHLKKVTDQIITGDYSKAYKAYSSVAGVHNNESDKKWIIDLDGEDENSFDLIYSINECIIGLQPNIGESKTICRVLSKNGSHLITSPFNIADFKKQFPKLEIHKNNPTNIFIP